MSILQDPKVFFATKQALQAWPLTSLILMAFGCVAKRFGLSLSILLLRHSETLQRGLSL